MGYHRAGFEVVGVDNKPQPSYPFAFHQADALEWLREGTEGFDVIHASPPCQFYANVTAWRGDRSNHAELVIPTRLALRQAGCPYVIENVREAKLEHPFMLCGSALGLRVKRHRYFETNWPLFELISCNHTGLLPFNHKGERAYADAMGCMWMSNRSARQAIPPAYTEFIGNRLAQHLSMKLAA